MPPGILDDMKPFLDYRDLVDGVDYRQCIFIFISNIGSNQIEAEYQKVVEAGKSREEIVLRDFEKIVAEEIFTHEGNKLVFFTKSISKVIECNETN